MNKKVCHITSAHNRYDVRIFLKQCKSLSNYGYDVVLLVNDEKPDEKLDGVEIISTGLVPKNRLNRFFISLSSLLRKAIEIDAQIYHLHDPDLLIIGNKLKKMGKKVIFDSHEDTPEQIKDKNWIPVFIRSIISKVYKIFEKSSVKKYDAIITVTPHIVERFKSINSNTVMVTNYPIIDLNQNIEEKKEVSICFAGGVTEQWNHHKILEAIEDVDGIKYILAGSGPSDYISMLKSLPAWEKVEYKGKIPYSEVKAIYKKCIAGMALNYSTQASIHGTLGNTKLFEIMEAKLPVICTNYILWKKIIERYSCGICVDPNNKNSVKEAIKYIINNPQEAKHMGENGRKAVEEEYNWCTQERILLELYNQL